MLHDSSLGGCHKPPPSPPPPAADGLDDEHAGAELDELLLDVARGLRIVQGWSR